MIAKIERNTTTQLSLMDTRLKNQCYNNERAKQNLTTRGSSENKLLQHVFHSALGDCLQCSSSDGSKSTINHACTRAPTRFCKRLPKMDAIVHL